MVQPSGDPWRDRLGSLREHEVWPWRGTALAEGTHEGDPFADRRFDFALGLPGADRSRMESIGRWRARRCPTL